MAETSPQLHYAPRVPLLRRHSFRLGVAAATLAISLLAGWVLVPICWQRAQLLAQQRQAMRFLLPPTTVVVEPDIERARALWNGRTYYSRPPGGAYHIPIIAGKLFVSDAVFLHGLRRTDDTLRLVHVSGMRNGQSTLRTYVAEPATFLNPRMSGVTVDHPLPPGPAGERPRLYAGQPDPNEPSRFTIKYEYSDRSGVIRGALRDDDTILFEHVEDEAKEEAKP